MQNYLKFNNIELFSDNSLVSEFKQYALQDSICLLNALNKAQKIYAENNNVDITSILSTSTLSFKIWRKKYLNINIPILKG